MKILLIEADFIREVGQKESCFVKLSAPALGVNYLASILRNQGHKVIVLDSFYEYLRTNFTSPIDIVKGTIAILEQEEDIECVGISITSPTRNYALNIARQIKSYNPEIKVIGGGPHITILQELFLEKFSKFFDFLVIGEGDKTLPELISALDGKTSMSEIAGIIYSDSRGGIKKSNPRSILSEHELNNFDTVPFTDYKQYQKFLPDGIIPSVPLVTTRGCPYHCAFCYSPRLWGKYRKLSSERVLAEIGHLIEKYKVRNIRFQDDTFTFDKNRCLKILEGITIKKWNIELYMHTRFDCIDEDIVEAYVKAGGKDIYFGLESGSQPLRMAMDKNHVANKEILEICRTVKNYGINLGLWLIFGYPGETDEDIQMTYNLVSEIQPHEVNCNPAHVHPYTPLFYQAEKEGIYRIEDWLNNAEDFFPYFKDERGAKAYQTCTLFANHFSKTRIRAILEKCFETTLGRNCYESAGKKLKLHS